MATTYDEISEFLNAMGVKHEVTPARDLIRTGFQMHNYVNQDGNKVLFMAIRLHENGEYLEIMAPRAYVYKEGPHKLAVMQALMMVQYRTKLIQYEYDADDGEIRPVIEFPLEDARLTQLQLRRVLMGMPQLVDEYDGVVRKAIETGQIEFGGGQAEMAQIVGAISAMGPDAMREILAEIARRRGQAPPDDGAPPQL